ncbi:MAG: Mrp/NBP35 family ATP-binding protein [Clostridiales bacterium]|nr:Mrp/NBP35 family ATP-binding protein [Clostridiales bacterium]
MGCTHNCETCGSSCSSKNKESMIEKPHDGTKVKKIIGIVSGKGGVGKSLVTSLLAVAMQIKGSKTAILDADITGPSIPKAFGLHGSADVLENAILPKETATGIKVMSTNFLLQEETAPVIWRGPVIAGLVKQFWTDVIWGDVDFMFVDMPPGTGDVPLTVFQSLPIDGIVIVTTPQDLVEMIVKKAANMANMMNVPILGMVENMSYLKCPHCDEKIEIYGKSKVDAIANEYGVKTTAKLPINPDVASAVDEGAIETIDVSALSDFVTMLQSL